MSEYTNFRDGRFFPTFRLCPDEDDIALDFYVPGGHFLKPKFHWCLLAEITHVEDFLRLRLIVKDKSGTQFPIAFHLETDEDPEPHRFRVGDTIAILYPHQHSFLDMTVGIRQEVASGVKVFQTPLEILLAISERVQAQGAKIEGKRACHACGKRNGSLLQCARCRLSWYCNKECQATGWNEKGHKEDCRVLKDKDIQEMLSLRWDCFDDFLGFPLRRS